MSTNDAIQYHSSRAMRELNLGLIAGSYQAARAHLGLSSLHLDKLRELKGDGARVDPPLSM